MLLFAPCVGTMTVRARGLALTLNSIQARRGRFIVGIVGNTHNPRYRLPPVRSAGGYLIRRARPYLLRARRVIRLIV